MAISQNLANQLLDKALRGVDFTPPATIYVALHTADPGTTGTAEVSGGGYTRQAVQFGPAAAGEMSISATVETTMPAATVTHAALWSAQSGGEVLWSGELDEPKTYAAGDIARIQAGELTVRVG